MAILELASLNEQLQTWLDSFIAVTVKTQFEVLEVRRISGWCTVVKVIEEKAPHDREFKPSGKEVAGDGVEFFHSLNPSNRGKLSLKLVKGDEVMIETSSTSNNHIVAINITVG